MNINFPPADESYIMGLVKAGYYSNPEKLIIEAVRHFKKLEDNKKTLLAAALKLGETAIDNAQTAPYTPQLLAQIEQDARKHAAEGGKPNPDICP